MEQDALSTELHKVLPIDLHRYIPEVISFIDDIKKGVYRTPTAEYQVSPNPALLPLLTQLSLMRANITTENSTFSFGSNNQYGDITVGDVAGGDVIKLTFHIHYNSSSGVLEKQNADASPPTASMTHQVVLFGKTSVGKTAIISAISGLFFSMSTSKTYPFIQPQHNWLWIDSGAVIMDNNLELTTAKIQSASLIVFVVDEEPFGSEISLFDTIHVNSLNTPKVVFVNKWDRFNSLTEKDRKLLMARVINKVNKYVKSPIDIVFGNAQKYNPDKDELENQDLVELKERIKAILIG